MYNGFYKYLLQNNTFYEKQFEFEVSNSTEDATTQLIGQILNAFNENKYRIGIFIDLSKAFDTVDQNILLKKIDMYGTKEKNLKWFHNCLTNIKQFIKYRDQNSELDVLRCDVPQGSTLGSFLFLIFVNDLKSSAKLLNPIMFANDTNFFYTNRNIKVLFETVNKELHFASERFLANNLLMQEKLNVYFFINQTHVIVFH